MKYKSIFLLLLAAAFLPACKKCYSCTYATNICYTCSGAGVGTQTECSQDYSPGEIANFKVYCANVAGTITSVDHTAPTEQQCFEVGIIGNINRSNAQTNCEINNGTWSLK